jgi:prolyl-tRNA synthetase
LIGPKGLAEGKVEIKKRADGSREMMSLEEASRHFQTKWKPAH